MEPPTFGPIIHNKDWPGQQRDIHTLKVAERYSVGALERDMTVLVFGQELNGSTGYTSDVQVVGIYAPVYDRAIQASG